MNHREAFESSNSTIDESEDVTPQKRVSGCPGIPSAKKANSLVRTGWRAGSYIEFVTISLGDPPLQTLIPFTLLLTLASVGNSDNHGPGDYLQTYYLILSLVALWGGQCYRTVRIHDRMRASIRLDE